MGGLRLRDSNARDNALIQRNYWFLANQVTPNVTPGERAIGIASYNRVRLPTTDTSIVRQRRGRYSCRCCSRDVQTFRYYLTVLEASEIFLLLTAAGSSRTVPPPTH